MWRYYNILLILLLSIIDKITHFTIILDYLNINIIRFILILLMWFLTTIKIPKLYTIIYMILLVFIFYKTNIEMFNQMSNMMVDDIENIYGNNVVDCPSYKKKTECAKYPGKCKWNKKCVKFIVPEKIKKVQKQLNT